jgi:hypothetical protein
MASIALVVVEPGSDWPAFVCGAGHDVVGLSQASGESNGVTPQRVCDRAEHSGAAVRLAVLACNAEVDDDSIHRRAFTASRLLTTVAHTNGGQLILSASSCASAALRLGLVGLAATLSNVVLENLASVSVRIGDRVVWCSVARPSRSAGAPARAEMVERLFAAALRDRNAGGAALALDLDCLSSLPQTWRLDANAFEHFPKGGVRERKALPS